MVQLLRTYEFATYLLKLARRRFIVLQKATRLHLFNVGIAPNCHVIMTSYDVTIRQRDTIEVPARAGQALFDSAGIQD